ncbi:MAG: LysR family transcriptional regulator [Proteobacteria bacterium]|nr:LysR family transcriptional regulator [Pseudomonadota bacterium]
MINGARTVPTHNVLHKTTLEQWRMFQAVASAGGFNQAAALVHKSQSSIHHAVQKLESTLGVSLCVTRGRRVHLTPVGELMLRRASYVLDEAARLESLAAGLREGVETELTIAVDHAFPQELVYDTLNRVVEEYDLLCINLRETVLSGANELLLKGQVDLAISPFTLPDCLNEEICSVPFIAVARPGHALHQTDRELALSDLKSHRQIVVRDSASGAREDQGWLGAEQRWTVDHLRTSMDLVSRGLGFAWLPEPLIRMALAIGELQRLNLGGSTERHVTFYLNFVDADRLGPATRAFMGELRYRTM